MAPVTALFLRASFYVPTVAEAARARHLARRPGASLTYFEDTDLAVVAHGNATIIEANHPDFAELTRPTSKTATRACASGKATASICTCSP